MTRLRRALPLVLAIAAVASLPTRALARYEGDFNVFIGQKWLKQGDWEPVDQQPEIGLLLAFAPERSRIWFAIEVLASEKNGTTLSPLYGTVSIHASTQEYGIGVRKVWNAGATRPFLGGGGCLIESSVDLDAPGFRQSFGAGDYGAWIETGVTWRIGKHFNLGFDLRYSYADARYYNGFESIDVAVGGFHAGALLGYGW
jgi:hypothetical protein